MLKLKVGLYSLLFILLSFACQRENIDKIRMNPDLDYRYEKALAFYEAGDYQKAQYLLEDLMGLVRGSEKSEKVYYYYASTHHRMRNYSFSSYYFRQFYNTFPNSEFAEEALFLAAESSRKLSPNFRLTQEDTEEAIEGYQFFVNMYPLSDRVSLCNEQIDLLRAKLETKALEAAKGYYKRSHYQAAVHSFDNLLLDFPDTQEAPYIRYMIIKSSFGYAEKSILSKQVERFEEVIEKAKIFERKHSDSRYASEVKNMINISKQRIKRLQNEWN